MHMHMHMHMRMRMHMHMYIHTYVYAYAYAHAYTYQDYCIRVHAFMHVLLSPLLLSGTPYAHLQTRFPDPTMQPTPLQLLMDGE